MKCPCCGQAVEILAADALLAAPLGMMSKRVLRSLISAYPGSVDLHQLVDRVYVDHHDGGAMNAEKNVREMIAVIRRAIIPLGWTVPPGIGGHGSTGYRLTKL